MQGQSLWMRFFLLLALVFAVIAAPVERSNALAARADVAAAASSTAAAVPNGATTDDDEDAIIPDPESLFKRKGGHSSSSHSSGSSGGHVVSKPKPAPAPAKPKPSEAAPAKSSKAAPVKSTKAAKTTEAKTSSSQAAAKSTSAKDTTTTSKASSSSAAASSSVASSSAATTTSAKTSGKKNPNKGTKPPLPAPTVSNAKKNKLKNVDVLFFSGTGGAAGTKKAKAFAAKNGLKTIDDAFKPGTLDVNQFAGSTAEKQKFLEDCSRNFAAAIPASTTGKVFAMFPGAKPPAAGIFNTVEVPQLKTNGFKEMTQLDFDKIDTLDPKTATEKFQL